MIQADQSQTSCRGGGGPTWTHPDMCMEIFILSSCSAWHMLKSRCSGTSSSPTLCTPAPPVPHVPGVLNAANRRQFISLRIFPSSSPIKTLTSVVGLGSVMGDYGGPIAQDRMWCGEISRDAIEMATGPADSSGGGLIMQLHV